MKIPEPLIHRLNYNKITNYIYIGNDQCCQIHFKNSLLKKGIRADISLEKEKLDHPGGVDYFLWIPTVDHFAPSPKQLLCGAKFIKHLVENKIKMYVHCRNGHGRAPSLVGAYLILEGKTTEQAVKLMQKKRKTVHLSKHQFNGLKKFEKKVRGKG